MARFLSNKEKYLRRFGMAPPKGGEAKTSTKTAPPKRKTDFGIRLEEKQRLKFIYGVLERQLHHYAREAFRRQGDPRVTLLQQLEIRLDNVVYRLGFAATREQARQLVSHRHVLVNVKKISIRSYPVQAGDTIALSEKILKQSTVQEALKQKPANLPGWLERHNHQGLVRRIPTKEDLPQDINMQYVIEFLSQRVKR
jgi:small subunit ribosomal protein S4